MDKKFLESVVGFDWNTGNNFKNWHKHNVSQSDCEQVFFNMPLFVHVDAKHSNQEARWFALGKTNIDRTLFVAFTIRDNLIRVISARDMSKKERSIYEKNSNT
ncbi:MAG: hypothetical protein COB50_05255 [Thiotrichales bacterium]|nr:MAG: hypothetical protein COB50_05255 [Thiotrichales bacterium]